MRTKKITFVASVLLLSTNTVFSSSNIEVGPMQLVTMSGNPAYKLVTVDTRGGSDFANEHIPGAINMPYTVILSSGLYKESTIVLYCESDRCSASKLAAKEFITKGYTAMALTGGFERWKAQGYKTEGLYAVPPEKVEDKIIYPEVLREKLKSGGYAVADTRPAIEYKAAHIPGAANRTVDNIASFAAKLDKGVKIVICDRDSRRAQKAIKALKTQGFAAVELSGGIVVWAGKKFPLAVGEYKETLP